jgi:hypothetical protein
VEVDVASVEQDLIVKCSRGVKLVRGGQASFFRMPWALYIHLLSISSSVRCTALSAIGSSVVSVPETLRVYIYGPSFAPPLEQVADKPISDCASSSYDLVALPGGMPGAERLRDSAVLRDILSNQAGAGKKLAAICASPAVVFEAQGLMKGRRGTAHPAFSDRLGDQSAVKERVVVDGTLTTSRVRREEEEYIYCEGLPSSAL